ncbi:MAG: hypothetical protein KAY59_11400 [Acidobacteria bacterium]|jgi:hypothetical protein|nr:hypothetical protein [Acidobacteriota bacterium]
MNDQELRQIVRQAIAQLGATPAPEPQASAPRPIAAVQFVPDSVPFGDHVSHAMYMQLVNTSSACVIEEHVSCDHCGYCKSHGH